MYKEKARKFMEDDLAVKGENHFVKEVYRGNITDPKEILNWYRNLYYKEGTDTERGVMARAINDLFTNYSQNTHNRVL